MSLSLVVSNPERRFRVLVMHQGRLLLGEKLNYFNSTPGMSKGSSSKAYVLPEGVIRSGEEVLKSITRYCKEVFQLNVEGIISLGLGEVDDETGLETLYFRAYCTDDLDTSIYSLKVREVDYFWCALPAVLDLLHSSHTVVGNRTLSRVVYRLVSYLK